MKYIFDGKIELRYTDGEYEIYVDGEKKNRGLCPDQLGNARLAINDYTSEIHEYLRNKARRYLTAKGKNPVTGCDLADINCKDCRAEGKDIPGTKCLFPIEEP